MQISFVAPSDVTPSQGAWVVGAAEGGALLPAAVAADKASALITEGASIYVGDHPGDMAAAHASSAYAVGVTTGANDEAALLAAGADLALPHLDAFAAWLPGHALPGNVAGGP